MLSTTATRSNLNIEMLLLVQSGTYQEQAIRPFMADTNSVDNNALYDAVSAGNSANKISAFAADIIKPEAMVEGIANIPEGWNSRRFRTILKVIETNSLNPNSRVIRLYTGYSDHSDVSYGGAVDPNTRIYLNNVMVIDENIIHTTQGMARRSMLRQSSQILSPCGITNMRPGERGYTIRPYDLYENVSVEVLTKQLNSFNGDRIDSFYTDNTVLTRDNYALANRKHNSPTRYLSDIIGACKSGMAEHQLEMKDMSYSSEYSETVNIYDTIKSSFNINTPMEDPFIADINHCFDYHRRGYVTLAEIQGRWPEAQQMGSVTLVSLDNGQSIRKLSSAVDSNHWTGADNTTISASMVAQIVPSLMLDCFIRGIAFHCTNAIGVSEFDILIVPEQLSSFINEIDITPYLVEFERRLITDLLRTITHNGQIPFRLSVLADTTGEIIIDISLNEEPMTRYVAPSFADSLFSPMVTGNRQKATEMSSDMVYLFESVIEKPKPYAETGVNSEKRNRLL